MSLIPDPPLAPVPHALEFVDEKGDWGGPTYRYRGVEIRCLSGGHVCALFLAEVWVGWRADLTHSMRA